MEPEQINDLLNTMGDAVRAASTATPPVADTPPPEPPPPAKTGEEILAMFQPDSETFDPEAGIAAVVQKNYGPLISSIGQNAAAGMFSAFKEVAPDIDEFRPQIEESLKGVPQSQWNQGVISQLYLQAKGAKQLRVEREAAEKDKGATTLKPSPEEGTDAFAQARAEMPEEEKRVAKRMFPGHGDPVGRYLERLAETETGTRMVGVPLGGGKKG